MYKKLVPETVHFIIFVEKVYIYLSFVSFIWNHLQKCFLQLELHIELLPLVHQ